MKLYLFLNLFYVSIITSLCQCPDEWNGFGGRCYWKSLKKATRDENLKNCKALNATLVSIRNKKENSFLLNFLKGGEYFWLSGYRVIIGQSKFNWDDSTEVSFTDWNPYEPSDLYNRKNVCIDIHPRNHWGSLPCDKSLQQLCEKPMELDCTLINIVDEETRIIWNETCPPMLNKDKGDNLEESEIDKLNRTMLSLAEDFENQIKLVEQYFTNETIYLKNAFYALKNQTLSSSLESSANKECCEKGMESLSKFEKRMGDFETLVNEIGRKTEENSMECKDIKIRMQDAERKIQELEDALNGGEFKLTKM